MRSTFGPVLQNAFVVPDLQKSLDHWISTMGVGPFFLFENIEFSEIFYRGQPLRDLRFSVAIAYWNDLQIELIHQWNDVASIYTDFPARTCGGLQHMGVLTDSVQEDLRRLAAKGVQPVQQGITRGGLRFAYVATDQHPGGMIELIERHPPSLQFFESMRIAARDWDGSDPIRRVG